MRGIRVCDDLSRFFDLHLFNRPHASRSVIRLKFTAAEVNSSRVRTAEENRVLQETGSRACVWQSQGNLTFSTAEVVIRDLVESFEAVDYFVLDFRAGVDLNESACHLLYEFFEKLALHGKRMLFTHASAVPCSGAFCASSGNAI